jgi:hypothetical protein
MSRDFGQVRAPERGAQIGLPDQSGDWDGIAPADDTEVEIVSINLPSRLLNNFNNLTERLSFG